MHPIGHDRSPLRVDPSSRLITLPSLRLSRGLPGSHSNPALDRCPCLTPDLFQRWLDSDTAVLDVYLMRLFLVRRCASPSHDFV